MKKILLLLCFIASTNLLVSNDNITLVSVEKHSQIFNFDLHDYRIVWNADDSCHSIFSDAEVLCLKTGAPIVPHFVVRVALPIEGGSIVKCHSIDSVVIENIVLENFVGFCKSLNDLNLLKKPLPLKSFFPENIVAFHHSFASVDCKIGVLELNPFRYNPQTRQLIVYKHICFEVATEADMPQSIESNDIVASCINATAVAGLHRYKSLMDDGELLIVAAHEYIDAVAPLARWKNRSGVPTRVVDYSQFGSQDELQKYIAKYYRSNKLRYLLLVGDATQIPSYKRPYGYSDLAYGYLVGDDFYPEISVGRFSGNSVAEIEIQVRKTIEYEQNPKLNDNWSRSACLVASDEKNTIGQSDAQIMRSIGSILKSKTYLSVDELYDGSQYGNPTAEMLRNSFDDGRGLMLYLGHATKSKLSTTGFSISDVNLLSHNRIYPFMMIGGCNVGDFVQQKCIAEYLNQCDSAGSVAVLASTEEQWWEAPSVAIREFSKQIASAQKKTLGSLIANACMYMNDVTEHGPETTDAWVLFGDPSLRFHYDSIQKIEAVHQSSIKMGATSLAYECNQNDAYITLMQGDVLLYSGRSSKIGNLRFEPIVNADEVLLTISSQNCVAYCDTIIIEPSDECILNLSEVSGIDNFVYSESRPFNLKFTNIGNSVCNSYSVQLSSESGDLTFSPSNFVVNDSPIEPFVCDNLASVVSCSEMVADSSQTIVVVFTDLATNRSWTCRCALNVELPKISVVSPQIVSYLGNDNIASVGEFCKLSFYLKNLSSFDFGAMSIVPSTTGDFTIVGDKIAVERLSVRDSIRVDVPIVVSENAKLGSSQKLNLQLNIGQRCCYDSVYFTVEPLTETFDDNSHFSDLFSNDNSHQWQLVNNGFDDDYCLRSPAIGDDDTSSFRLTIDVAFDDSLSFCCKTSCEEAMCDDDLEAYTDYCANFFCIYNDCLEFLIDDVVAYVACGESDWMRVSFPISSGRHTFVWRYLKDFSVAEGDDCAWIDNIELPNFSSSILKNSDFRFVSEPEQNICFVDVPFFYDAETNADCEFYTYCSGQVFESETLADNKLHFSEFNSYDVDVVISAFDGKNFATQNFVVYYDDYGAVETIGLDGVSINVENRILQIASSTNCQIILTDILGRKILSQRLSSETLSLEIDRGVYELTIINRDSPTTQLIIIQ